LYQRVTCAPDLLFEANKWPYEPLSRFPALLSMRKR
jgi:hypothetical protein